MTPAPKRYLWRRFWAFIVDFALISLLTTLVLAAIMPFADGRLRLDEGFIRSGTCWNIRNLHPDVAAVVSPARVAQVKICSKNSWLLFNNGLTAEVTYDVVQNGNVTRYKRLTYAIDSEGKPIFVVAPQGIILFLSLILYAAFSTSYGAGTIGKRLLKLQLSAPCAICREARKWGPILLWLLAMQLYAITRQDPIQTLQETATILERGLWPTMIVQAVIALPILAFYIWNLWRPIGQAWWDKSTQTDYRYAG